MTKPILRIALAAELLSVAALVLWLSDVNPFSSEVTVYSVYCGKDAHEEGGCINLQPIMYSPSPERQEVAYRTDTGIPTTLTDCNVRDRSNWECWYKDRGGRLTMADGAFREEVLKDIPGKGTFDSVRHVPKWKWWTVKLGIGER